MVVLTRDPNAMDVDRYLGMLRRCYNCGRYGHITKNCWYRGRKA